MTIPGFLGRYRIERELGRGGMGIVYAAVDEALGRRVALKTISTTGDDQARKRFWREARAAASVSHPNVCPIYEVGEVDGVPFLAMELLQGEPLSARIARGPLAAREAVEIVIGMLAALGALHARDVVHRDLKPSNVFLTPHGVKLLDFGLARTAGPDLEQTASVLTQPGTVMGTPRYMSPEQLRGQPVDLRTDLFSTGAVLFEMLTGQPAFGGRTAAEVFEATLNENPPALAGSPCIAAVDLVIRRALAKAPGDRYLTAAAMADPLRAALQLEDSGSVPRARAMTRFMALPFRMLRPDPESEFLAVTVPEAVASALGAIESLVVRSSLVAARWAESAIDLRRIAAESEVDVLLTGALLRVGDDVRVTTQLVEVPEGTLVWSHAATIGLRDVFQLQDELVGRIVDGLSIPLTAREQRRLHGDVPATGAAYEYYLRANRLAADPSSWGEARQLYERCVGEDPRFAPAWARLGRIYRVVAKYYGEDVWGNLNRSEQAFRRALELNPDLTVAHNLYTYAEVEAGRARDAMVRLLERTGRGAADPELFAGLVTACRYCGLLDASLAADRHARRLDPQARTSVAYTHWLRGEYEDAVARETQEPPYMRWYALAEMSREAEAIEGLGAMAERLGRAGSSARAYRDAIRDDGAGVQAGIADLVQQGFRDPEGLFFAARALARVGARDEAIALLGQVVAGYTPADAIASDRWLSGLHDDARWPSIVQRARESRDAAADAFRQASGPALLGTGGVRSAIGDPGASGRG